MWTQSLLCSLAILFLGYVFAAYRDVPTSGIMAWLTASIFALATAVFVRPNPKSEQRSLKGLPPVVCGTVGMFAAFQLTSRMFQDSLQLDVAVWLLGTILVAIYFAFTNDGLDLRICRTRILPVFLTGFLLIGVKAIHDNPNPPIDVFLTQQTAADALIKLRNPFTAQIPIIYSPDSPAYIPLAENGHSLYGGTYPPLTIILELPAYLLAHDVRYTHLVALLLSSYLIAMMRVSWFSLGAATLLLLNPMSIRVVVYAWIEPLAVLLFILTLFAALRYPALTPWIFGLFLASKQTHMAVLPLVPFLISEPREWKAVLRFAAKACAVVAALYLPFYFWNPQAFVLSLITVQLKVPLRLDLISYPAYIARRGWLHLPVWLPFLYLPLGWYVCLRNLPRTLSAFALAVAAVTIPFFALSKQGAPNYYFLAFAVLCSALALNQAMSSQQSAADARQSRASA
jgi:hypothetical protein